jgi:hypothetical protein
LNFTKSKKGYFFVIDAFIGSTIIFLSLLLILNSDVKASKMQYDYGMSEDYSTFIMNTKIQDLNNPYAKNLTDDGVIVNTQNTIIEQIDTFYYNAYYVCLPANQSCITRNLNYSARLMQNLTDSLISAKYGFSMTLIDTSQARNQTIYSRNTDSFNSSKLVISSKKITFVQINSTTMFGPNIMVIKIWI